ncbi:glycosyl transferase [bacterium]|nr:glycosyl transferase [bacterium]
MADFHQTKKITTLHRLKTDRLKNLEIHLEELVKVRPVALILPALYRELESQSMGIIRDELKKVTYLNEIIVTMGETNAKEFKNALKFFSKFPKKPKIIWNTGKRIQRLHEILEENDFKVGEDNKGRSAWLAYGYILANNKSSVIVQHDCDILSYNRELLARLCYPLVNQSFGYEFCKGYYSRVTDRLHGRVTRLFVTPLIRSLMNIIGDIPYLEYMDSFRYPLSGEFGMHIELAQIFRIPGNWGLEVGILSEIYRNTSLNRICQVELCENYEHKHQALSAEDPEKGLMKMAIDISKTFFKYLAFEGIQLTQGLFRTLQINYLRLARETIERYEHDALLNGLKFDRHHENLAVEAFSKAIGLANKEFFKDPLLTATLFPNWSRVISALPEFFDLLLEVVEQDNA